MDKIFVCHHPPLTHRKEYLTNFFSSKNINVEWVEKYSPEEIVDRYDDIVGVKDFTIDPNVPGVQQNQYTLYKNAGKRVTIPELSLYLKQEYCFRKHVDEGYDSILILEDDILLPDNFSEYLNVCYSEFKNHNPILDCVVLGSCFGFRSQYIKEGRLVHYGENQITRCAHAIMYSLEASKKIVKNLYPINWPVDFKLNEIIIKEDMKVGWTEPSLQQASHLNLDKSSIQL